MTPDNGQVLIQFPERREGTAGDTKRGNAKQDEAEREQEREREEGLG